jgi:hypothetical protein
MLFTIILVLFIVHNLVYDIESFEVGNLDKLYFKKTQTFNKIWYNQEKNYSIWEPESDGEYYPMGNIFVTGDSPPNKPALLIKSNTNNQYDRPKRYEIVNYILLPKEIDGINKIGIWKPIPNKGYKSMGYIFQLGHHQPSIHRIRCVDDSFIKLSSIENMIIDQDCHIKNIKGYNIWSIYDSDYFIGNDKNNHKEPKERVYKIREKFLMVKKKLPIKKTKSYKFIWKGYNKETKQHVSIWRPIPFNNYVSIGDIVYDNSNPNGILETILVNKKYVKLPENFGVKPLLKINLKDNPISFWKPKAPKGYGCIGYIGNTNTLEPKNNNIIYCIPLEYLDTHNYNNLFWNTMQLSKQQISIWKNEYNTFVVNKGYNKPIGLYFVPNHNYLSIEPDIMDITRNIKLKYKLNIINSEIYDEDKRNDLYINSISSRMGINKNRLQNIAFKPNKTILLDIVSRPSGSNEHDVLTIINNMKNQIKTKTLKINNSRNDGYISNIVSLQINSGEEHVNNIPLDNSRFINKVNFGTKL